MLEWLFVVPHVWVSLFIKRTGTQKNLLNHTLCLVEKTIHHNVKHVWNRYVLFSSWELKFYNSITDKICCSTVVLQQETACHYTEAMKLFKLQYWDSKLWPVAGYFLHLYSHLWGKLLKLIWYQECTNPRCLLTLVTKFCMWCQYFQHNYCISIFTTK